MNAQHFSAKSEHPHSFWLGCSKFISVNNKWTVDEFPSTGVSAHQAVNPTGLADNMKMNQGVLGRIFVTRSLQHPPDGFLGLLQECHPSCLIPSLCPFLFYFNKSLFYVDPGPDSNCSCRAARSVALEGAQQLPMSTMCESRMLQNKSWYHSSWWAGNASPMPNTVESTFRASSTPEKNN